MSLPIRNSSNAGFRPTSTVGTQPQAPAPTAQNTVATPTPSTSAQYRASVEQSAFEGPVAPTAPRAEVQTTAPVDSIAVSEPMAPAAPAAPQTPQQALDQLKQLPLADKKAFLQQFGVSEKHLKKAKEGEINAAFDRALDSLKEPGKTKFKMKIGGKKYEAKINLNAQTGQVDVQFKQKKGFFSKVGDALKKVGKIALQVASFIPGPVGVVARVANAVISSVQAFKSGNILGGIAGMAGAVAGGAGAIAGKATAGVARTVANVATAVERGANAVSSGITAARNGDWSGLLGAVASGARGAADAIGSTAGRFAQGLNNVADWATRGRQGLDVIQAARTGDIVGALSAGTELANDVAPNSRATRVLNDINGHVSKLGQVQSFLGG
ncbi:MAG TPA: hypothetical protein VK539_04395 [Myxococcaceae bacterium]|nr:hypothetical protein [Myxococcaceae bacterium]